MHDDTELLRRYLDERSEAAFTALVHRHLGLVYATALRRVGHDAHLAEDVAQKVFTDFARKAPSLRNHASLAGWLYAGAHCASAATVRQECRRKTRETEAQTMQTTLSDSTPAPDWDRVRPALDDLVLALRDDDREAVVLRFFQQRSFAEIGTALRLSEEAARKRVDRSLDRLRAALAKRGVTSTAAAVGLALSETAIASAPAGLAVQIAGVAFTQAAATGVALTSFFALLKSPFAIAAGLAAIGAAILVPQHQTNVALREELARHIETSRAIPALRAENSRLATLEAEAEGLRRAQAKLPALRAAAAPPAVAGSAATERTVITLTSQNSIMWAGELVTLREFVARLHSFRGQNPAADASLLIRGQPGVTVEAMAYVLDEARKAQITKLSIESDELRYDQLPLAKHSTSWF